MRDFSSRPRRRAATAAERVALVVAALALAASAYGAFDAWADARRVRGGLEQARRESESVLSRAQAFQSRNEPAQLLAAQALLTAEAPPVRIVSELALLMPGDVRLEGLRLAYGNRLQVEMRVAARAAGSYDLFLGRLEASPLFTDVLPGEENRDGELRALVRAVWRGPGA